MEKIQHLSSSYTTQHKFCHKIWFTSNCSKIWKLKIFLNCKLGLRMRLQVVILSSITLPLSQVLCDFSVLQSLKPSNYLSSWEQKTITKIYQTISSIVLHRRLKFLCIFPLDIAILMVHLFLQLVILLLISLSKCFQWIWFKKVKNGNRQHPSKVAKVFTSIQTMTTTTVLCSKLIIYSETFLLSMSEFKTTP